MPWHRGRPNAGFSKSPPWLPMPPAWDRMAVDAQAGNGESVLGQFRRTLATRRRIARRLPHRLEWRAAPPGVLAYSRGPLTVACNFEDRPARLPASGRLLLGSNPLVGLRLGTLRLPPNSAAWLLQ
jgi:alpha-glucosidase